jgi:hypothetical protein
MKANLDANRSQEDDADEAVRSRTQTGRAQEQAS